MPDTQAKNIDPEMPQDISTEIFIKNWKIYRKIIENNNMSHREGYAKLREILINEMKRPFSFLDLACGDAYYSSKVLMDTKAEKYIGIDVSEAALTLAKEEFRDSDIETSFVTADFLNFAEIIESSVDVIWVGFSVHHLDTLDKLQFMKKVKKTLSNDGIFIIYEPILLDGEDRGAFLERFNQVFIKHWRSLSEEEGEYLLRHVRATEKPESTENWIKLGKDAGFSVAEEVFFEKTGLYKIFKYC